MPRASTQSENQALDAQTGTLNSPLNLFAYVMLNTADCGTTGANENAQTGGYVRQSASWNNAANGSKTNSAGMTFATAGTVSVGWFDTASGINLGTTTLSISAATAGGSLAAGTYYWVVTALNAALEALKSNEVSGATSGGNLTIPLSWTAVPGATSYRVYRGTATGVENVYYAPGNVTSYNDTGAANTAGSPPGSNGTTGTVGLGGALASTVTAASISIAAGALTATAS